MNVSIVFITWNRAEDLRRTLAHTLRYQQYFNELIVIDNGSSDNTAEVVKFEFPQARLIRLHRNTGVCEARNIGAINANNELLLFLDDDGFFDLSMVPLLVNHFKSNERLAVLGCQIIQVSANKLDELVFESFKPPVTEISPAYTFEGTAFMVRRSVFMRVGMFPDYFFYSNEEDDLSLRLIKEGYEVGRCNQAIMLHYASPKQRPSTRHTYYYYRNIHFQIWRNLPAVYAIKESLAVALGGLCRTIFNGNFLPFCRGTLAAIVRLPRVIAKERSPLSLEQYRLYATLRGPEFKISRRVRRLVREVLLAL
ncbi:MAG: glycosyltransferase [Candidatus Methanomethylicaceae archaeon]